jgi:hypothetical protein
VKGVGALVLAVLALAGAPTAAGRAGATPCRGPALAATFSVLPGSAGAGNIVYTLKVTNESQATCTVSGFPTIDFLDASGKGEIFPPADHPLVLTVGDTSPSTSIGPTADHRVKPDLVLADSRAFFTNGEVTAGASNAAAYFAGVVALLKASEPGLRTRHLLGWAHEQGQDVASASDRPETNSTAVRGVPRSTARRPAVRMLLRSLSSSITSNYRPRGSSELLPPPRLFSEERAAPSELRPGVTRRLWRTPSPQELANLVRRGR